jgi:hypothetical protein
MAKSSAANRTKGPTQSNAPQPEKLTKRKFKLPQGATEVRQPQRGVGYTLGTDAPWTVSSGPFSPKN